jgi:hypothetical protein
VVCFSNGLEAVSVVGFAVAAGVDEGFDAEGFDLFE